MAISNQVSGVGALGAVFGTATSSTPPPPPPTKTGFQQIFTGAAGTTPPAGTPIPPGQSNAQQGPTPGLTDVPSNLPLNAGLLSNSPSAPGKLLHGYMKTSPDLVGQGGVPKDFYVYFLFNPAEIDTQYNFDSSVLPSIDQTAGQQQQGLAAIFQNQAMSFQLEFDRTYEVEAFMASPAALSGNPNLYASPGRDGVWYDIRALERLLGMYDANNPQVGFTSLQSANAASGASANSPQMSPIDVFFGTSPAFAARGWISALEIELVRFSHSMVPTHCTITLTLARTFLDPKELDINLGPPGAFLDNVKGAVLPPDPSLYPHITSGTPQSQTADTQAVQKAIQQGGT